MAVPQRQLASQPHSKHSTHSINQQPTYLDSVLGCSSNRIKSLLQCKREEELKQRTLAAGSVDSPMAANGSQWQLPRPFSPHLSTRCPAVRGSSAARPRPRRFAKLMAVSTLWVFPQPQPSLLLLLLILLNTEDYWQIAIVIRN